MRGLAMVLSVIAAIQSLAFAVLIFFLVTMSTGRTSPGDLGIGVAFVVISALWVAGLPYFARRFWKQQRFGAVVVLLSAWSVLTWGVLGMLIAGIYAGAA